MQAEKDMANLSVTYPLIAQINTFILQNEHFHCFAITILK